MTTPGAREVGLAAAEDGAATATGLAEKAVLGSLLCRPERLATVQTWLRPRHFATPETRALFAALTGLARDGHLLSIPREFTSLSAVDRATDALISQNLVRVLAAVNEQRFGETPRDLEYWSVLQYCWAGGNVRPQQLLLYGEKIVEMAVRRHAADWGARLEKVATSEHASAYDEGPLLATRDAMIADLTDLAQKVAAGQLDQLDELVQPDTSLATAVPASVPRPISAIVSGAGSTLVNAVIAHPEWHPLLQRLRPDDFMPFTAEPGSKSYIACLQNRNTWEAIQALYDRDEHIDPIMVAFEVAAFSGDTTRTADHRVLMDVTAIGGMRQPPATDIGRAVEIVTRSARAGYAREARLELDRSLQRHRDPQEVVQAAEAVGTSLAEHAQRLAGRRDTRSIGRGLAGEPVAQPIPAPTPAPRTR